MLNSTFMPTEEQWAEIKADSDPPAKYASIALGIPKEKVPPAQRAAAKVLLFGVVYGQSGPKPSTKE